MKKITRYQLNPILELIITSGNNKKKILQEFNSSKEFFIKNPEKFVETLINAKDELEKLDNLSEFELFSLNSIYEVLDQEEINVEMYFSMVDEMIIDSFEKIYEKIIYYPIDYIKENKAVEIMYYSVSDYQKSNYSKLCIQKMKFNALDFIEQYQMFYN